MSSILLVGQYYMPIWFGAPNPNIPTVGDLLLHKGSVFGSLPLRLCVTRNGQKTCSKNSDRVQVSVRRFYYDHVSVLFLLLFIMDFLLFCFPFVVTFRKFLCTCVMCVIGFTVFLLLLFMGNFLFYFILLLFGFGCMHYAQTQRLWLGQGFIFFNRWMDIGEIA